VIGWVVLAVVVAVLALAVPRYGVDTRTGENWRPGDGVRPVPGRHATVGGDLASLVRLLSRGTRVTSHSSPHL